MMYVKSSVDMGGYDANGKRYIIIDIECDTDADLPATNYFDSVDCVIGQSSKAHVISTNADYQMQSDGTWTLQQAGTATYTKAEIDTMISAAFSDTIDDLLGMGDRLPDTGIDANDYDAPGVYRMQTTTGAGLSTNIPRTDLAFKLQVEYINNSTRILQTFTPLLSSAAFYRRTKTSGGWQSWYLFEGTPV